MLEGPHLQPVLDGPTARVVELSRQDWIQRIAPRSLAPHMLSRFLGMSQLAPLADPRLEAVRRFCVLARHGDGRCDALRRELAEAGYTDRERRAIEQRLRAGRETIE